MTDQMSEPFTEERWLRDLTGLITDLELDQFAGIDADVLSEYVSALMVSLVRLVKERDRGMPEALGAVERSELAVLRRANRLQEVVIANGEEKIARLESDLESLRSVLADAYAQRDRARSEAALYALKEVADRG